jgi:nucleotide-binding universal stress UspA family protein
MDQARPDREEFGPAPRPVAFERGTDGPRVIMVGTDGSATSQRAAAYAAGLARRQHAHLVVVFVATVSTWTAIPVPGVLAAREEAVRELLAQVRAEVRAGAEELRVPVTFLYRRGDPYAELRRVADEVRADLVVVGTSSRIGRRVVGSIAGRLVRQGRWPVTVVP